MRQFPLSFSRVFLFHNIHFLLSAVECVENRQFFLFEGHPLPSPTFFFLSRPFLSLFLSPGPLRHCFIPLKGAPFPFSYVPSPFLSQRT